MSTESEQRAALRKIINAANSAFLVTSSTENGLHGRPMANAEVTESVSEIYFASERDSGKVEELAADDRVFLGYVQASNWATVSGRAAVVDDRQKIRDLWSPLWRNWFDGPEDPKIVLIRVTPEKAEYWEQGTKVVALAKMAFTAATGQKTTLGDHAKISM